MIRCWPGAGAWLLLVLLAGCAGPPSAPPPAAASLPALERHLDAWAGTPYRWGGADRSGVDCSGYVQLAFRQVFRVSLPRTTADQSRLGRPVARRALAPGDLVFFRTGDKLRHVGIYLGNGRFGHASTRRGVTRSRLDNPYWSPRFLGARRVL